MEETIKEIASLLRSTEDMADQFVQRVQGRVARPVSPDEILRTMKKVSNKSLTMEKVVVKLQQQKEPAKRAPRTTQARKSSERAPRSRSADAPDGGAAKQPRTIVQRLAAILDKNWERAEKEGLDPERMPAEDFVQAIYQYTDRREGTPRRILQAAQRLDQADVLLTPALVADTVHELFQS
jgi:chaperone required for assembly of F1-ATPase